MILSSEERRHEILQLLQENGKIYVNQLAQNLDVTPETIRKDLTFLEEQKLLKRIHGGAIPYTYQSHEPSFEKKRTMKQEEKKKIGRRAAMLIEDGDTIAIDIGTTTVELAAAIEGKQNLKIITNSLAVANILCQSLDQNKFDGKVMVLGGTLNEQQQSFTGSMTCEMLSQFRVDKAFISCVGITEQGVSDTDIEEVQVSKKMVQAARESFILADYSKLDTDSFCMIAPLTEFSAIICDKPCLERWQVIANENELTWICTEE
jgi:DeoR/GlpR family transcriptional regulator of sugar metabolism